MVIVVIVGH